MKKKKNKKIKLCFVLTSAYPLFNTKSNGLFGGAEVSLYNLAMKLSMDPAFEITFCVGEYGQQTEETYGRIKVKKFRYQPVLFGSHNKKYEKPFYKLIRQLFLAKVLMSDDYDVYLNTCGGGMLSQIIVFGRILQRRKVIFRLASDSDADAGKFTGRGGKIKALIYKACIRKADAIICQSDRQKALIAENFKRSALVIKNGFFIDKTKNMLYKKHILWVSRSHDNKRPELFVQLARQIPEEKFVIIMPGNNNLKKRISAETEKLPNIELLDFVPFTSIQGYFENAKLFVNTSVYEGFPNTFIQACLAGTPLLSFRVDPDGFIAGHELGLVCHDNFEQAVSFIKSLDNNKICEYGKNALDYVHANHNIEDSANKYKECILDLLNKI